VVSKVDLTSSCLIFRVICETEFGVAIIEGSEVTIGIDVILVRAD
jgi:hypothetical protein